MSSPSQFSGSLIGVGSQNVWVRKSETPAARARLLCVHGVGTDSQVFEGFAGACAPWLAVWSYDQSGQGQSPGSYLAGIPERAAELAALAEHARGQLPLFVLGHSLGGAVALEAATHWARLADGLVLCGSGYKFDVPEERLEGLRQSIASNSEFPVPDGAFAVTTPLRVREDVRAMVNRGGAQAALAAYRALRQWRGCDWESIACPVLAVVGEFDYPELREQAQTMTKALVSGSVAVVANAGHMLPVEQPGALARVVEAFVGQML